MAGFEEGLRADERVKYLWNLDAEYDPSPGRHLIEVPLDLIQDHPEIKRIRGDTAPKIDHLKDSVIGSGGPTYPICLYVQFGDGENDYFCGDGAQRLRAVRSQDPKPERIACLAIESWRIPKDVIAAGVDLNTARIQMTEDNYAVILRERLLDVEELKKASGEKESSLRRLKSIAEHSWVWAAYKEGVLGKVRAADLVDSCDNSVEKLEAFQNTLEPVFQRAVRKAKEVADQIRSDRTKDYKVKFRKMAEASYHVKGVDWDHWIMLLKVKTDGIIKKDGRWLINLGEATSTEKKKQHVWIGDDDEWKETVCIEGFFAQKWADLATDDIKKVRGSVDLLIQHLDARLKQRRISEAEDEVPSPRENPVDDYDSPTPPDDQPLGVE